MTIRLALLLTLVLLGWSTVSQAAYPPAHSGCGLDGPTQSPTAPTVQLPTTVVYRAALGTVRVPLIGATQTASASVSLQQAGGRRIGGTSAGSYTCTDGTRPQTYVAVSVSDYGRRRLRHRQQVNHVLLRIELTNASGVTNRLERRVTVRRVSVGETR